MAPPAKSKRRSRSEKKPRAGSARAGSSKARRELDPAAREGVAQDRVTVAATSRARADFRRAWDDMKTPPRAGDPERSPRPRRSPLFLQVRVDAEPERATEEAGRVAVARPPVASSRFLSSFPANELRRSPPLRGLPRCAEPWSVSCTALPLQGVLTTDAQQFLDGRFRMLLSTAEGWSAPRPDRGDRARLFRRGGLRAGPPVGRQDRARRRPLAPHRPLAGPLRLLLAAPPGAGGAGRRAAGGLGSLPLWLAGRPRHLPSRARGPFRRLRPRRGPADRRRDGRDPLVRTRQRDLVLVVGRRRR